MTREELRDSIEEHLKTLVDEGKLDMIGSLGEPNPFVLGASTPSGDYFFIEIQTG